MEATTMVMWLTMIAVATPANVTDAGIDYNVSSSPNQTSSSSSSSRRYRFTFISTALMLASNVASMVIGVVGCLANAYVLLALLLSKNSRASNVNVFITHQTILDLAACALLFLGMVVKPAEMSYSTALFICWFFDSFAVATTAGNASVGGLMIITLERYVKIVHPVAYRNRYRPWMTRAGIVLPWIFGIATGLIPTWVTSYVKGGRCMRSTKWSNPTHQLVWNVWRFILLYLGPLYVFVFGYWKILAVVRRQRKQVAQSQSRGTSKTTMDAEKASKQTEMNVIKTVVLVSATFAICFVCIRTYTILTSLKVVPGLPELYVLFSVFSYSNRCLNPFIYATQYEIVRRWWKIMMCRLVRGQHANDVSQQTPPVLPGGSENQQTNKSRVNTKHH